MIVLYILLFILFLSALIMIHELGHLLTAKMFNVYCYEYAVGFGPKLFSFKRKKGETYFSLRLIPFGGYVSMYGESENIPEGVEIDPSRSLFAIKKWKRAIILVAGVTMNFVLALVMFQIYEVAFPHYQPRYAHIAIEDNSLASEKGLKTGDLLFSSYANASDGSRVFYDDGATITYSDSTTEKAFFGFNYAGMTYKDSSLKRLSIAYTAQEINTLTSTPESLTVAQIVKGEYEADKLYQVKGYVLARDVIDNTYYFIVTDNFGDNSGAMFTLEVTNDNATALANLPNNGEIIVNGTGKDVTYDGQTSKGLVISEYKFTYVNMNKGDLLSKKKDDATPVKINFNAYVQDQDNPVGRGNPVNFEVNLKDEDGVYVLPDNIGISMQIDKYYLSYGESVKQTFVDFGSSAGLIFKTLGRLFYDGSVWNDIGGIIAVGVESTRSLKNFGFGDYLRIWAMISVNLGIINLLPFPGLDGWQLLVVAVEGIFKKEIPQKVKNWVSIIGLVLLFALMILVVVKDIIRYVVQKGGNLCKIR